MQKYTDLVQILQQRAIADSPKIAYRFLQNGTTESGCLTYQELDLQASAIASMLQSLVSPGSRALLIYSYDAGLEFVAAFMGCLYAGVVAVTTTPPRQSKDLKKLAQRVTSSGAEVILTTEDFIQAIKGKVAKNIDLVNKFKHLKCFTTDNLDLALAKDWKQPIISPDTLAFFQYTSGSTGNPKGVMVTHENILYNQEMIRQGFAHDKSTIVVGWLPLFHDMGLIGNVLQPLFLGVESILMSPVSLAKQPFEWLKAITNYQATTSGGPNFAYDLLCLKATPEKLAELDLGSWSVAFSGAETVRAETIERFSHIFANCGFNKSAFYPCYGMAETTLFITGGVQKEKPKIKYVESFSLEQNKVVETTPNKSESKAIVSCGKPWLDTEIIIVNHENLTRCENKTVGEIWVRGSGVSQGYWNQEVETQDTFQVYLADSEDKQWLRTGDLGFLANGELYITGRLKEVMIFWGRYCYPQHVEQTVQKAHPALRENAGAAFAIETEGAERLVIVQEVERSYLRSLNIEEIVTAICHAVGQEHEVEVSAIGLIKTGSIPKTSSGKIQRRACAKKFVENSLNVIAKWQPGDSEKTVTEIFNL
ncbi:Acyl-CoA synthetase (AMP-forming)/AMP-acid ligase II [Hyella patelloides LEGE 07179]|uniref:Acyl-CoA synthetase (AMP-forming)/AMP-acid ligase II n=1 Tax=Hyella patelloides LEGE 07179 TaxID=945734 RepID=A0A563VYH0_9CYAN|nr:fatty acyl-AMP ligase [Hyella patelloides]VEP16469.1 Acyl-CoA synthetase (AMP-forming)/AMP-acid ligase II [Hyella patelloides LEGE 07179]